MRKRFYKGQEETERRKGRSSLGLLLKSVGAAVCLLGLVGCSTIPQPTREELLAQVNAEHQAIEKPEVAVAPYSQYVALRSPIEHDMTSADPAPDGGLSVGQAEFDINALFDGLHRSYGLYDFYGGDAVFEAARQQALEDCRSASTLDADVLKQIILDNLSFVTDQHFFVDGTQPSGNLSPCFFTEVAFQKTEDGYSTADGKAVASVDGQKNLDELFKRSLTKEGEIVYYPIIFADVQQAKSNPPSLTIRYADGSEQTMTALAYEAPQADPEVKEVKLREEKGIPILYAKWIASQDFVKTAQELKGPVNVIDLTCNGGGYMQMVSRWWKNYVGEAVPTNNFAIYTQQNAGTKGFAGLEKEMGVQVVDGWTLINTHPDNLIENENLLVILTSKGTASAAEMFVDLSHNVENTLVIGENTAGCMTGNMTGESKLMYSRIEVGYGNMVTIFPEGDFKEGYGFEPDLWCPAVYAEEAALNLLERFK